MYRRTKKYQQQVAYLAATQADREQKQLDGANPVVQTNLPELRRIIEITDFDSGTPMTHRIELYRSDRIDCYNVNIDGQPWVQRMGWSRILAALRKALPRLRQFY